MYTNIITEIEVKKTMFCHMSYGKTTNLTHLIYVSTFNLQKYNNYGVDCKNINFRHLCKAGWNLNRVPN